MNFRSLLQTLSDSYLSRIRSFLLKDEFVLGLQQEDEIKPKAPKHYGAFELSLSDITKDKVDKIYSE